MSLEHNQKMLNSEEFTSFLQKYYYNKEWRSNKVYDFNILIQYKMKSHPATNTIF